jgi:hypothetical protein
VTHKEAEELNTITICTLAVIKDLRILAMKSQKIPTSSKTYSLNPFVDDQGILSACRQQRAKLSYNSIHPIILDSRHPLTKLLLHSEHIRLLHGLYPPLLCNFHILGGYRAIRWIVWSCVIHIYMSNAPRWNLKWCDSLASFPGSPPPLCYAYAI